MTGKTVFGVAETIGKRKDQEDYVVWTDDVTLVDQGAPILPRLTVIADGMGGHAAGNVASQTATKAFLAACLNLDPDDPDLLGKALDSANAKLGEKVASDSALEGMGCTLIGLQLNERGDAFRWISVGDSLLLAITADGIHRLNEDHSFREDIARITESGGDASGLPSGNVLRSAVMGDAIPLVDDHSAWRKFADGETLVLATDGLDTLSNDQIASIVRAAPGAADAAKELIKAVETADKPRQDNTTVVVMRGPPARAKAAPVAAGAAPKKRGMSTGMLATMLVAGLLLGGAAVWAAIMLSKGEMRLGVGGPSNGSAAVDDSVDDGPAGNDSALEAANRRARAAEADAAKADAKVDAISAAGATAPKKAVAPVAPKPTPTVSPSPTPSPSASPADGQKRRFGQATPTPAPTPGGASKKVAPKASPTPPDPATAGIDSVRGKGAAIVGRAKVIIGDRVAGDDGDD